MVRYVFGELNRQPVFPSCARRGPTWLDGYRHVSSVASRKSRRRDYIKLTSTISCEPMATAPAVSDGALACSIATRCDLPRSLEAINTATRLARPTAAVSRSTAPMRPCGDGFAARLVSRSPRVTKPRQICATNSATSDSRASVFASGRYAARGRLLPESSTQFPNARLRRCQQRPT